MRTSTKRRGNAAAGVALAALAAPLALGCISRNGASDNAIPLVRVYAERDLDCPQSDIRVVQEWGGRFKAIGCGRKEIYVGACDGLACEVHPGNEAIPWRDRPDPATTRPR